MATENLNKVTEEQQEEKDTTRYWELDKKTDRNEDENREHGELKTKYANTAKNRIGKLSGEKKAEKSRADTAEERANKAEQDLQTLKDKQASDKPETIVGNENETIEIGGKKYYTDNALSAQIKSGKITEQAGIDYQATRNEEKIVVRVKGDFEKDQEAKATKKAQTDDAEAVLNAHPEFGLKHPDHNPNDPFYKEWRELVANGYGLTNGGLMKALKKAKKNLGIKDTHIDRSGDLGLEEVAPAGDKGGGKEKEKEITFSEVEENSAVDMFTSAKNPATGRLYTRDEAIAKGKEAKKRRMSK